MQKRVELLNTKEYSQVLIVTTFKHDDLPKVYPKYVKKNKWSSLEKLQR